MAARYIACLWAINYVEGIAIKHWHGDLTGLMVEARDVSEKLQKAALKKKETFFLSHFFLKISNL